MDFGYSTVLAALLISCNMSIIFGNRCYSGYYWSPWEPCSQTCGGGFRTRVCPWGESERERCGTQCFHAGEFYAEQCHCVPGTTGTCCDDIKECNSNPCKNGGTCEEGINFYTCRCPAGTTGTHCDDILECASNPCKNGGTCIEYVNFYKCECPAGTTGPECDDILECQSNPCLNGGTCVELINGYTCQCLPGTTGDNCVDIPECISNPCQNGATCVEMINMYKCNCTPEYTAVHCQKYLLAHHDSVCRSSSCYVVFLVKDTWQGAEEFCEARNGHLVVLDSMEEALYVENYLESIRVRFPESIFWLGAKKSGTDSPQWVHGYKSSTFRWPQGVSDDILGTQCLAMDGSYGFKWQGFSCDRPTYFVCEEKELFHLSGIVG